MWLAGEEKIEESGSKMIYVSSGQAFYIWLMISTPGARFSEPRLSVRQKAKLETLKLNGTRELSSY